MPYTPGSVAVRTRFRLRLAGTTAVLAVVAACSASSGAGKPIGAASTATGAVPTTANSSTSVPEPTTTSLDSTKAAILAAYRGMWTTNDAAFRHYPINYSDPSLANYMMGDELKQIQASLTDLAFASEYLTGPPTDTSMAIVTQLRGTLAVVSDCDFDRSTIMNGRTNQVVKPASTQRDLINAELELAGSVWKVTEFSNVSVGCTTAN